MLRLCRRYLSAGPCEFQDSEGYAGDSIATDGVLLAGRIKDEELD